MPLTLKQSREQLARMRELEQRSKTLLRQMEKLGQEHASVRREMEKLRDPGKSSPKLPT